MKKIFVVFLVCFISILNLKGESPLNIGLKFGTNNSKLTTNFKRYYDIDVKEESINNYLAGAFVRVNFGRIYIQPEAYFNSKGGTITQEGTSTTSTIINTIDFETIDVPLLAGFKIVNKPDFNLRVNAGPMFSFVTGKSSQANSNQTVPISDMNVHDLTVKDFEDRYVGWQAGVGIDIYFFTIDAVVENSGNIYNNNSSITASNRAYLITLGIKLF